MKNETVFAGIPYTDCGLQHKKMIHRISILSKYNTFNNFLP